AKNLIENDHNKSAKEQTVTRSGPVNAIIDSIRPGGQPTLHYLHVMLPHQPWIFYPDGQPYTGLAPGGIVMPDRDEPDPWIMAELQQGHLFQAQYADNLVGEVIEQLKTTGRYDDSLVVVTSDHGVTFSSFPDMRTFGKDSITDLAYVPLIIKEPKQSEGRVDESNLMGVDLLPTMADVLGLDLDWEVDGYPAGSPEIDKRGDTKDFFEFPPWQNSELAGIKSFESSEYRPKASDRLVGPVEAGDHPLKGLVARIGAEQYLDRPVKELGIDGNSSGTAQVDRLDMFQSPPEVVIGRMLGKVGDVNAGRTVLVAFNGTVVSAGPVRDDGAFETLLPPGIQDPDGNEITLYQVASDGTISGLNLS
ncbi:MAG: sulfatase-like hydrolase/transferase, partial [Aquihabitans sp.]